MHYFTVVLLPKETLVDELEQKLSMAFAPYDESLDVAPYPQSCSCIGRLARDAGWDHAEQAVGPIDGYRDRYWKLPEPRPEWEEFIKEWREARIAVEEAHHMFGKPDPECDACNGTGLYQSTYNPKSKWDYWQVGGRWDGTIKDDYRESENGFNWGPQHEDLEHNSILVSELPNGYVKCYAVLLPDGTWVDREIRKNVTETEPRGDYDGDMPDDQWEAQLKELFGQHQDCIAIGCDIHI